MISVKRADNFAAPTWRVAPICVYIVPKYRKTCTRGRKYGQANRRPHKAPVLLYASLVMSNNRGWKEWEAGSPTRGLPKNGLLWHSHTGSIETFV